MFLGMMTRLLLWSERGGVGDWRVEWGEGGKGIEASGFLCMLLPSVVSIKRSEERTAEPKPWSTQRRNGKKKRSYLCFDHSDFLKNPALFLNHFFLRASP